MIVIGILLLLITIITVVSVARYLYDKVEHTVLDRMNKMYTSNLSNNI